MDRKIFLEGAGCRFGWFFELPFRNDDDETIQDARTAALIGRPVIIANSSNG
jgi:hypothetical protein